jgi:hypothetical protein
VPFPFDETRVKESLGGLLQHVHRQAAYTASKTKKNNLDLKQAKGSEQFLDFFEKSLKSSAFSGV